MVYSFAKSPLTQIDIAVCKFTDTHFFMDIPYSDSKQINHLIGDECRVSDEASHLAF